MKKTVRFKMNIILVTLVILISIFTFSVSPTVAKNNTQTFPVEFDVLVQYLSLRRPQVLLEQGLESGKLTDVMIQNQPQARATIKSVKQLPITILAPQPDGSVKEFPDPTLDFSTNLLITLSSTAQIEDNGLVLGKGDLKIGKSIGLSGFNYDFKATVVDLRILQDK